jgi:hypothetical protein
MEGPENDVCRVSYFLRCCVSSECGIALDVPTIFLDHTVAHHLPPEQQQLIFSLALQAFRLDALMNRVIFIDDEHLVLPQNASHSFVTATTPSDLVTLSRIVPSVMSLPTTGKLLLCTSEWLNMFYVSPLIRYSEAQLEGNSRQQYYINHQQVERIPRKIDTGKQRFSCDVQDEHSDEANIPMAVAVPLDEPASRLNGFGASLFAPGQFVRLSGLKCTALNEQLAVVAQRVENRVIVRVPGDPRPYSVKAENLIFVEGSISFEYLPHL